MARKEEHDLYALAAEQHGLWTRPQLRAAGVGWHQEQARIASGEWELLHDKVVRAAGAPATYRQKVVGAALSVDGVVSHRSAATIYGIGGIKPWDIEVSTLRGRIPQIPGVTVHRPKYLPDEDVVRYQGVAMTTPVRTLHDLGAVVSPQVVKRAAEDVVTKQLGSKAQMHDHLERWGGPGRGGTRALRAGLAVLEGQTEVLESVLEEELLALLEGEGFSGYVTQRNIVTPEGVTIGRVDVLFPRHRLVIEALGWEFHSSLIDFLRDNRRRNELLALGYRVLAYMWDDVERPAAFLRVLRTSLAN